MAYSRINIIFGVEAEVGDQIRFTITDHDTANVTYTLETCALVRTRPQDFTYSIEPDISARNYKTALELDYNSTSLYTITEFSGNSVIVEAKKENVTFGSFSSTNAFITGVVANEPLVDAFAFSSVLFTEATSDVCNKVSVDVTALSEITQVTAPVTVAGDGDETISFDYARGTTFNITITNGTLTKTQRVTSPGFLVTPNVSTVLTPTGANVTINGNTLSGLTYSLDGVTYKTSSVFYGITEGSYTAYVKDSYGCIKTVDFEVTGFETSIAPTIPYSFISNTNSIRFKKDEVWDNINIYKNDFNTLSYEEDVKLVYPYNQKFQSSDIITTQIKTNYSDISIKTILEDGTENVLTTYKRTSNIGREDMRDSLGYEFPDGERYGIYFQTGNTYDYQTGLANGTYELYGTVPAWGKIGQYFYIDGYGYYQIQDIVYEEAINSEVLVISSLAGSPTSKIVSTKYNVFNWDAYEFDVDMSSYLNKCFQIEIELTDTNFDTVKYLSEKISVYSSLEDLLFVKYKNTSNNEIIYATDIEHKLRLDYTLFGLASETSIEIHKTDNYVYSLNSDVYKKKKVEFVNLSTMMAQKVIQALSLDIITINGVQYTTENITEPSRIGVTNLYKIEATLYKSTDGIEFEDTDVILSVDQIEVPSLVKGNTGFIEL